MLRSGKSAARVLVGKTVHEAPALLVYRPLVNILLLTRSVAAPAICRRASRRLHADSGRDQNQLRHEAIAPYGTGRSRYGQAELVLRSEWKHTNNGIAYARAPSNHPT